MPASTRPLRTLDDRTPAGSAGPERCAACRRPMRTGPPQVRVAGLLFHPACAERHGRVARARRR